jgi:beta-glucosidase
MSPNLNVNRDPRWGRNRESFGEDSAMITALGASYIHGIQRGRADAADAKSASSGYLKIMSVPKHLGAYSLECFNPDNSVASNYPNCPVYRSNFDAVVDEIDLRETYFPGWQAAVDPSAANAQGVMCSYNTINGVPDCLNGKLLRETLNEEWHLEGFVISDAGAIGHGSDLPIHPAGQNFSHGLYGAAVSALTNGTVISIESSASSSAGAKEAAYQTQLLPALEAGDVTIEQLRAAATRALLPRFKVGLYDDPELVPWNRIPASVIESPAHHALARRAAAESFVLLKNRGAVQGSDGGRAADNCGGGLGGQLYRLVDQQVFRAPADLELRLGRDLRRGSRGGRQGCVCRWQGCRGRCDGRCRGRCHRRGEWRS